MQQYTQPNEGGHGCPSTQAKQDVIETDTQRHEAAFRQAYVTENRRVKKTM